MNVCIILLVAYLAIIPVHSISVETAHPFNLTCNATSHLFLPRGVLKDPFYERIPCPEMPHPLSIMWSFLKVEAKHFFSKSVESLSDLVGIRRWRLCYEGPIYSNITKDSVGKLSRYDGTIQIWHCGSSCKTVNVPMLYKNGLSYFRNFTLNDVDVKPCLQYAADDRTILRFRVDKVYCKENKWKSKSIGDEIFLICSYDMAKIRGIPCTPLKV